MSKTAQIISAKAIDSPIITEQTSLPPKISTTISLGLYEETMSPPEFDIDYQPADTHDDVRAMFVKVPQNGEYYLQCVFQNFTNRTFKAVIREKHA